MAQRPKIAEPRLGHHRDIRLVDAARRHAAVSRFDDHRDAAGLQDGKQRVGDLLGQSFLQLQPATEGIHQSRQLRYADHAPARTIGDVDAPGDRRQMMLAGRNQRNVAKQDTVLISVRLIEDARQIGGGIDGIA